MVSLNKKTAFINKFPLYLVYFKLKMFSKIYIQRLYIFNISFKAKIFVVFIFNSIYFQLKLVYWNIFIIFYIKIKIFFQTSLHFLIKNILLIFFILHFRYHTSNWYLKYQIFMEQIKRFKLQTCFLWVFKTK